MLNIMHIFTFLICTDICHTMYKALCQTLGITGISAIFLKAILLSYYRSSFVGYISV